MNFINLNCPPLPYFIVGGGCVYRPGDIHERRTIRNVFDLIYVHSGTLYLEQDPFRVELNAGQFFIITPDTPHRGSRVCQEKTTTSWVHFYTNGKYSLSDEFYPDNVTRRAAPKFYYSPQNFILSLPRTGHRAGSQPGEAGKVSAADEPGFFQQIHTEKELSVLRADAV